MPVDNRNFIFEDLPEDPEDFLSPEDDEDEEEEEETKKPSNPVFQPQPSWQAAPPAPATVYPTPPRPQAPWLNSTFQPLRPAYTPPFAAPPIQQQQRGYTQTNQNSIPRRKKIIFCDLIDILIESESAVKEISQQGYLSGSNNFKRTGIMPRGLYDIRLKTEVWGKFAAFGVDYVFCVTNQPEKSEEELRTWKVMTDFVMYSLADYLNLPHQNCKCLTKIGFDRSSEDVKPGAGLLKKALQTLPQDYKYERKDLVIVGINSGYQNQSDIDLKMAKKVKIDYIDVTDLLTSYY